MKTIIKITVPLNYILKCHFFLVQIETQIKWLKWNLEMNYFSVSACNLVTTNFLVAEEEENSESHDTFYIYDIFYIV